MTESNDPQGVERKAEDGCPVMHDSAAAQGSESENPAIPAPTAETKRPRTNRDWWPNALHVELLNQHGEVVLTIIGVGMFERKGETQPQARRADP